MDNQLRTTVSRLTRPRSLAAAAAAAACIAGLAACSSDDEDAAATSTSVETSTSTETSTETSTSVTTEADSSSAESSSESDSSSSSAQAGDPNVTLSVDPDSNLKAADEITVSLSGLQHDRGYYVAICLPEREGDSPVPTCTGARGDATAQAWLKAEGGTAPIDTTGNAVARITVTPKGEGIDCTTDDCVVKVFGDHSEGFVDVAQTPITFAK